MLNVITGLHGGGVAASTNSYESISTVTVGSGGSTTISFTSIPSTYKHLQIRAMTNGTTSFNPTITFNGDSGSNYAWHYMDGNGSSATSGAGSSQAYMISGGASSTANVFAGHIMDILDYGNVNKYKTMRILSGADKNGSGNIDLLSGLWMSTSAISSLTIAGGTFNQYSTFALYGVK